MIELKIRKVDDRPMVIHTKKKATLHTHRKREVSIKGSGVYTVRKGPRVVSSTISDSRMYRSTSERIKAKAGRNYRSCTVHSVDKREIGISDFKRRIRESNMSIKTKKTNLHIAGVAAARAAGDQLEGGAEIQQAAGIAYELSRPLMSASSKGAELFRRKAIAAKQRRIKQVKEGKKIAKRTARKAATEAGKTVTFAEMQPGDLIFFSGKPNGRYKNICHVAIYAGGDVSLCYLPDNYPIEKANREFLGLYRLLRAKEEYVPELSMEYALDRVIGSAIWEVDMITADTEDGLFDDFEEDPFFEGIEEEGELTTIERIPNPDRAVRVLN